ncbi:MAG TPA: IS1 family transposase [Pyrinomonadaceae bacterium]|nr:IS1 family transposase [Pyrinomonadaceae bacterium]
MVCHNCEANAKKNGKDKKGSQRFRCVPCNRTFTEYQDKPLERMTLPTEKAAMVVSMLLEGMSIRSVQRLTGVEKRTILKLIGVAGAKADRLLNDKIKALTVRDVQADELWGFVGMKMRTKKRKVLTTPVSDELGDCYTFVALETHSKLVLAYHIGTRDATNTIAFTEKLNEATKGHFQLSTDAWSSYMEAVHYSLGSRIDYAQLTKIYDNPKEGKRTSGKYSPSKFIKAIPTPIFGNPDMERLCTSHIERLNLTIRMSLRRLTRLTNAFSKKLANMKYMAALFFAFYNFCRPHRSLDGATPAMAHGIAKTFWSVEDLLRY